MRLRTYLILAGVAVFLASFGFAFSDAAAGSSPKGEADIVSSPPVQIDNDSCLFCHSDEDLNIQFKNGDILSLTINPDLFAKSTHGSSVLMSE